VKAATSLALDVNLILTLREQATREQVSVSALVEKLIRQALAHTAGESPKPLLTPPKLTTKARLVLAAVEQLSKAAEKLPADDLRHHVREYRIDEVCKKVGLFPSSARPALRECERAGVLVCSTIYPAGMGPDALWVDHWRLPKT
jgi:hypothetical protein